MIRLFHDNNIDFLRNKAVFMSISVALMAISTVAVLTRGFNLGIDFAGGTLVMVRFVSPPDLDDLRRILASQGVDTSSITLQPTAGAKGRDDGLLVRLPHVQAAESDGSTGSEGALQTIRGALDVLEEHRVGKPAGFDLNLAKEVEIAAELGRVGTARKLAVDENALAASIVHFRDRVEGGVIASVDDIPLDGYPPELRGELREHFTAGNFAIVNAEVVGPQAGADLSNRAIYATLSALAGMLVFIALRFEWIYGVGAILAVFHNVCITLGIFALFQWEINYTFVAAMLTLVGFSTNDTIVIFDRIREKMREDRQTPRTDLVNQAINQTLSRTVISAGTAFVCVLVLALFGGNVLKSFSLVLLIGIVAGTYSSIAIASPIMLWLQARHASWRRDPNPVRASHNPTVTAGRRARLI